MRSNNFNLVRLIAAFSVLFGHGYALSGAACEPLIECHLGYTNIARLAVDAFFVISGFLISESWSHDPNVRRFLIRRALRILPGLFVTVIVTTFVLGSAATTLRMADYFRSGSTWSYLSWAILQPGPFTLPGVFAGGVVNGSLWSLPIEAAFYIAVCTMGRLTQVSRLAGIAAAVVATAVVFLSGPRYVECAAYFVAGVIMRGRVRFSGIICLVGIVAAMLAPEPLRRMIIMIGLPYLILTIGSARAILPMRRWDLSYGVYLWAFPVAQTIAWVYPRMTGMQIVISSAAATVPIAFLSWSFIEARALRWKPQR